MTNSDKSFYQGIAVALYAIIKNHDQPFMAQDTLKCLGISRKMLEEADVSYSDLATIFEDHLKDS